MHFVEKEAILGRPVRFRRSDRHECRLVALPARVRQQRRARQRDTFRAAAVEQLKLWGERVGVPVVALGMNADPSAVAYEAVKKGVESGADIIIIDTAGRLHTKVNLMAELSKIKRVIQKVVPDGPHDILLVLDGSTGQNAIVQAREFTKATEVSCLAITKLDGTAKGGVVIGISDEFGIPVKYIGVGEKVDDLDFTR